VITRLGGEAAGENLATRFLDLLFEFPKVILAALSQNYLLGSEVVNG
jgi:hypothetical protein